MDKLFDALKDMDEGVAQAKKKFVEPGIITMDVFTKLVDMDPSPTKKYVDWMALMYADAADQELALRQLAVVNRYNDLVKRNIIKDKDHQKFEDVQSMIDQVDKHASVKSKSELKRQALKDAPVVAETDKAIVYAPKTMEAAQILGKGTKWCTSAMESNQFNNYYKTQAKNIYIVHPKPSYDGNVGKLSVLIGRHTPLEVWDASDDHLSPEVGAAQLKELGLEM